MEAVRRARAMARAEIRPRGGEPELVAAVKQMGQIKDQESCAMSHDLWYYREERGPLCHEEERNFLDDQPLDLERWLNAAFSVSGLRIANAAREGRPLMPNPNCMEVAAKRRLWVIWVGG